MHIYLFYGIKRNEYVTRMTFKKYTGELCSFPAWN